MGRSCVNGALRVVRHVSLEVDASLLEAPAAQPSALCHVLRTQPSKLQFPPLLGFVTARTGFGVACAKVAAARSKLMRVRGRSSHTCRWSGACLSSGDDRWLSRCVERSGNLLRLIC